MLRHSPRYAEHSAGGFSRYTCAAGDCNNLVLTAPDYLTTGRFRFVDECPASAVSTADITAGTASNVMCYIAHVHNPEIPGHPVDHFVLVQGYNTATDSFTVRYLDIVPNSFAVSMCIFQLQFIGSSPARKPCTL